MLKPVLEGMLEDLEQQQHILEEQDKSEQILRCASRPQLHACQSLTALHPAQSNFGEYFLSCAEGKVSPTIMASTQG